jgi:hypothetical protein
MIPLLAVSRSREIKAEFGHGLEVKRDRHRSVVAAPRPRELTGRFFVQGESQGGELHVTVSPGLVNAQEPLWSGRKLSELALEDMISGPGPYVCVKIRIVDLSSGRSKIESLEIVCSPTFGGRGLEYLHPLAIFTDFGKVAQLAYHDYQHTARALAAGRWAHFLLPA